MFLGFSEVSNIEVPFDLRWNPYIYQKVMMQLRQKHEDPDSVEYELISRANRLVFYCNFHNFTVLMEYYLILYQRYLI